MYKKKLFYFIYKHFKLKIIKFIFTTLKEHQEAPLKIACLLEKKNHVVYFYELLPNILCSFLIELEQLLKCRVLTSILDMENTLPTYNLMEIFSI